MIANNNNHSVPVPFIGGLLTVMSYLHTHLIHLFVEPTTAMTHDVIKTILLGFVGALASGLGNLVWTKYVKKRFKP